MIQHPNGVFKIDVGEITIEGSGESREGALQSIYIEHRSGEPFKIVLQYEKCYHVVNGREQFREEKTSSTKR